VIAVAALPLAGSSRWPARSPPGPPISTLDLRVTDSGLIEELQKDVPADLPLNDAARGALARALQRHGPHAPELTVANASRKTQRCPSAWTATGSARGKSTRNRP